MDNQAYLNQISSSNRPVKQSKMSQFFSSKFGIATFIGVGAIVIIIILFLMFGGSIGGGSSNNQIASLKYRLDSLAENIETYQSYLKKSDLRGSSATLLTVVQNTSDYLDTYISENIKLDDNSKKKLKANAETYSEELSNTLFNAKITGMLDQTYKSQMAYEITIIMNQEAKLYNSSNSASFRENLANSYTNLESLHDTFDS